jgi:hypothetical protein
MSRGQQKADCPSVLPLGRRGGESQMRALRLRNRPGRGRFRRPKAIRRSLMAGVGAAVNKPETGARPWLIKARGQDAPTGPDTVDSRQPGWLGQSDWPNHDALLARTCIGTQSPRITRVWTYPACAVYRGSSGPALYADRSGSRHTCTPPPLPPLPYSPLLSCGLSAAGTAGVGSVSTNEKLPPENALNLARKSQPCISARQLIKASARARRKAHSGCCDKRLFPRGVWA